MPEQKIQDGKTQIEYRLIKVVREGAVEHLTLARPGAFNALNLQLTHELLDYFGSLSFRHDVRVVVLRGEGRHFCAGFDLEDVELLTGPLEQRLRLQRDLSEIVMRMRRCPQPIIGVLQGAACGGGFALALACDMRFAAPDARMNVAMARIGLTGSDMGIGYFLPRAVGSAIAAELMYTGRFINADRAVRVGLVNEVVPQEQFDSTLGELLDEMLTMSPAGLRLTKESLGVSVDGGNLSAMIALEDRGQALCFASYMAEGVQAFREKRKPDYGV